MHGYLSQGAGDFIDQNDIAVITAGKNLDGTKATNEDKVWASAGILLPLASGKLLKELKIPGHHIFTNKNTKKGQQWTNKFAPMFEKAGYSLDDAINIIEVVGHKGPHPDEYHEAVYKRLKEATEGLDDVEYKKAFEETIGSLRKEVSTPGTELNKLLTKEKGK